MSLGPKRSIEKNLSKYSCVHNDKSPWPIFRRIIECERPQETIFEGTQALLTITVEL